MEIRNLTPEQCVEIARMIIPDVNWCFHQSKNYWNGFDLVDKESLGNNTFKYVFQIDYRDSEVIGNLPRFRYYETVYEFPLTQEQISQCLNYIQNIN